MWTTIGLIVMAVGFLGVLVCAKLKSQPLAMFSAVVMLAGLGIYAYFYMNGDDAAMEDGVVFQCAIMDQAGAYLKKSVPGKNVVMVVEPGLAKYENGKKLLDAQKKAFEKAYGGSVEIVELEVEGLNEDDGGSYADMMKAEDLEKIVAANESADIFVITVGLPTEGVPDFKEKTVFLTNSGMIDNRDLKGAIEDGKVTAVVSGNGKKLDPDFRPDDDNLKEAFNYRWIIVDNSNLDKLK